MKKKTDFILFNLIFNLGSLLFPFILLYNELTLTNTIAISFYIYFLDVKIDVNNDYLKYLIDNK